MAETDTAEAWNPGDTPRIGAEVAALERFYRAHYDELVRYLTARVTDPQDVADLVADTFLTAVRSAASFDPHRGRSMPWLVGIARNHLRHFHRERHNHDQAVRRIVGRRLLDPDDIADLEERIAAHDRGERAMHLLARLPPAQRELVDLVDLQGFTPAEAAAVCGIPTGLARVRLHRARSALRAGLPRTWNNRPAPEELT